MEGLLVLFSLLLFVCVIVMPFLIYRTINHVSTQIEKVEIEIALIKQALHLSPVKPKSKTFSSSVPVTKGQTVPPPVSQVPPTAETKVHPPSAPALENSQGKSTDSSPLQATREFQEALSVIARQSQSRPVTGNLRDKPMGVTGKDITLPDPQMDTDISSEISGTSQDEHHISAMPLSAAEESLQKSSSQHTVTTKNQQAADATTPTASVTLSSEQTNTMDGKATAQPAKPASEYHGLVQDAKKFIDSLISGGNQWVMLGVLILFIGIAFLAKNATFQLMISPGVRLAASAFLGTILLGLGWQLRKKRPEFAVVLQGGSIAILYLTVAAAVRLYDLLPPTIGFVLLIIFTVFGTVLSVLQNAPVLAHISLAGGFISPIMVSTGSGNYIALFSFYIILNLSVLATTWLRTWKYLHLNAFAFTSGIAILWAYKNYDPSMYLSLLPFLLFYFVFFSILPIIRSRNTEDIKWLHPNIFILFCTPLLTLGFLIWVDPAYWYDMPLYLLAGIPYISLQLLIMGLIYIGLTSVLFRQQSAWKKLYCETFLALAILFINLAPLMALIQLDLLHVNQILWGSCILALEGLVLLWLGLQQNRLLLRCFAHTILGISATAITLQFGNIFMLGTDPALLPRAFLNINFLGTLLAAAIFLTSGLILHLYKDNLKYLKAWLPGVYLMAMSVVLVSNVLGEISLFARQNELAGNHMLRDADIYIFGATLALPVLCLFCGAALYMAYKKTWKEALFLELLPFAVMLFCARTLLLAGGNINTPLFFFNESSLSGFIALGLLAIPALEAALHRLNRKNGNTNRSFLELAAKVQQFRIILLFICFIPYATLSSSLIWSNIAFAYHSGLIFPACLWPAPLALFVLAWSKKNPQTTKSLQLFNGYWLLASLLPLLNTGQLLRHFLLYKGSVSVGMYLPVLSTTDMSILLLVAALFYWSKEFIKISPLQQSPEPGTSMTKLYALADWCSRYKAAHVLLYGLMFITAHSIIARTVYQFVPNVEWVFVTSSYPFKAAVSVLWAVSGLAAMIMGNRLRLRWVWKAGAALLLLDAAKLLLIDRTMTEDLWIILSFILVGIILIATTYFAPLPAKAERITPEKDQLQKTKTTDQKKQ